MRWKQEEHGKPFGDIQSGHMEQVGGWLYTNFLEEI